jgi:hypothetical protein
LRHDSDYSLDNNIRYVRVLGGSMLLFDK